MEDEGNSGGFLKRVIEMDRELESIIGLHNTMSVGLSGEQLIKVHLAKNEALGEAIKKHDRSLRHFLGEKVEPVMHFGEAVLKGVFGGGVG